MKFRGLRTTLVGGPRSTYRASQGHALITVDERLAMEEMLVELSHLTTKVARSAWLPPKELRQKPVIILFYEDERVNGPVEYEITDGVLHYRLRPGFDRDTALAVIMDTIAEVAVVQGWQPLPAAQRAAV